MNLIGISEQQLKNFFFVFDLCTHLKPDINLRYLFKLFFNLQYLADVNKNEIKSIKICIVKYNFQIKYKTKQN